MFESFEAGDSILHSKGFMEAEVQYNLIHFIAADKDSQKIKTSEGNLIFAHSKGHNPWLWISAELEPERREALAQQLAEMLQDYGLPGITGEPETARLFAGAYCKSTGKLFHTEMMMEAYHCPQVLKPDRVSGELVQAGESDIPLISEYLARFVEDAFGT
ncbi:hypothetical protein KC345_g12174, partial [Hortaea werneckii]